MRTGRAAERWEAVKGFAAGLGERRPPTWLLGGLLALATWKPAFGEIGPGLDSSWNAGLQIAAHRGLEFGSTVIFTYGPLGFLRTPQVWYSDLAVLAFLYSSALYVALCCSLVWALRRSIDALGAVVAAFITLTLLSPIEQPLVIATIWCLALLSRARPGYVLGTVVVGGATLAAIESLVKVTLGPVIFAICLAALVGSRARRREVAAFVLLFVVELAVLWFASGQSLGVIPDYLSNVSQIVSGYSQAMSAELAPSWQAPVAVIALLVLVFGSAAGSYPDLRARICAAVAVALAGFLTFKQGLVRFEINHVASYFATVAALWLAIPWGRARQAALVAGAVAAGALAVHVIPPNTTSFDVIENVRLAGRQARTLLSPSRRTQITEGGRRNLRGLYRLDGRMLAELHGHTVSIDPWEIAAAWAYDLDWDPLPVFQNYSAYTRKLDELNADALADPAGPQRILRENPALIDGQYPTRTIDGRYPGWDPPAQSRVTFCNFRPLTTTARWQVLARISDRCARPRLIRSADAAYGETVPIPSSGKDQVVFVEIDGADVHGLERLRTFLFRARERSAILDGSRSYRLIPGTASDGLFLLADPKLTGDGPFAQIPQAQTIELTGGSGSLRFDFFRMNVRPTRNEIRQEDQGSRAHEVKRERARR